MKKLNIFKSGTILTKETKFEAFSRLVISILMIVIMGFLTLVSLLHTTGMEIISAESPENIAYYNDSFILNIIFLIFGFAVCFFILPKLKKIPLWAELTFIGVWTIILGVIWVNSSMVAPSHDSAMVTSASMSFAKDDYTILNDWYFKDYSFLLGYAFFNEIIIKIASIFCTVDSLIFIEILNVIFLAASYIGIVLINTQIFKDERIHHITVFLLAISAQPIIFSVFIYGIIPGLMFAIYGVYFEILYLKKNNIPCGILSIICIALSVMIKSNFMIVLIAMAAIAFVKMFSRKKFIMDIIYIVLAGVISLSISPMIKNMYENRSGIELGEPIPYISWIAMGLFESHPAPGWYNHELTITNFEINNHDSDAASASSVRRIKKRLKYFNKHPQYKNDFFYEKTVSQWNETTYQSIWNNKVRSQYEDKGAISTWVCNDGEALVRKYMDFYAQLIFASVLIGMLACLRNKNFLSIIFPLIILGGFLYHLISEAKSQYSLPYFVIMTGFAGYGICTAYDFINKKIGGKLQ